MQKRVKDTLEPLLNRLNNLNMDEIETTIKVLKSIQDIQKKEKSIPCSIFTKSLSIPEAIIKHLKEIGYKNKEIEEILKRKTSTINCVWQNAKKKNIGDLEIDYSKPTLPLTIFSKSNSIFETVVLELTRQGLSLTKIAQLLDRNYRNIWATHKKAIERNKI